MKPISSEQSAKIHALAAQFQLVLLYVFGSFARGDMHAQSDIDIAHRSKTPLSLNDNFALQQELRAIFKEENRDIDLVNIQNASPLLAQLINTEGKLLYGTALDADAFYRRSFKEYIDTAPLRIATKNYVQEHSAL